MNELFDDMKTDEEKSAFFLSGRGYETGVIAVAIQNDVAMAYHRCAEYKKELAALKAECEQLRKDAEFGRSVLSKREPGKVYGCHCDLEEGMEPDGCVIDTGERHNCIYAKDISVKEQCSYWRVIASDADPKPAELPRSLPDSLPMEPYQTVDRSSPHYKAGWNACRRAMLAAAPAEQGLL